MTTHMAEQPKDDPLLDEEELEAIAKYYATGNVQHLADVGMERVYDFSDLVEEDGTFELNVVSPVVQKRHHDCETDFG